MEPQARNPDKSFLQSRESFESLVTHVGSPECLSMSHSELESMLEREGRELLRCLFDDHLLLRAGEPANGPVLGAKDTMQRERPKARSRKLTTIFGEVKISRLGYGKPGCDSLFIADADLNLPKESYSLGIRRKVAIEAAKVSFDEVVSSVERATGVVVPKRQAEELAVRAAVDFEAFYVRYGRMSETEDEILVITTDGKGVAMRRDHLREATRKAAEKRLPKLRYRRTKGEKSATKRMAQVAAVYTVARFMRTPEDIVGDLDSTTATETVNPPPKRPKPHDKRVWASVERDPWLVIDDAFEHAKRLDPGHTKQWVALVDGGLHQLDMMLECIGRAECPVTVIIDLIHVLEYIWGASRALFGEGTLESEKWVTNCLRRLLKGEPVHQICAGMRRSATMRGLSAIHRKPVDKCANYMLRYEDFMKYNEAIKAGLPISTGVIEGACRYLVRDRMDITGARWTAPGAEAVLRLRALRASGDFEEYWRFHEASELRRNHLCLYANEMPPKVRPPAANIRANGHLRLVS